MDKLERMKKGGRRRDPSNPHPFEAIGFDASELGGRSSMAARACGLCGGSRQNPIHVGEGGSVTADRERHGPFGE